MFNVTIRETSRELTHKEAVQVKDLTGAIGIDAATTKAEGHAIEVKPTGYAVLDVHNDNSKDKDYTNYLIFTDSGDRFVTGSESFWNSFISIFNEMKDSDEEWALRIYRMPSKNRTGKEFITCSLI